LRDEPDQQPREQRQTMPWCANRHIR
jgi:hypothetical protein